MDRRHTCQIFTNHPWPNSLKEEGGWGLGSQGHQETSLVVEAVPMVVLGMIWYIASGIQVLFLLEVSRGDAGLTEPNR